MDLAIVNHTFESMDIDTTASSSDDDVEEGSNEVEMVVVPTARESQYSQLIRALGNRRQNSKDKEHFSIPCGLFLWGTSATGKSFVVNQVLKAARVKRQANVSAYDLMESQKTFLEEILYQLNAADKSGTKISCENCIQFFDALKSLEIPSNERIVITVDNVELLRQDHQDLFYILLYAQEQTNLNVCVIFCSKVPPTNYFNSAGQVMRNIPSIHFPQYTRDELELIIRNHYQDLWNCSFFNEYLKTSMDAQTKYCRDVRKLLRMFEINYKSFLQQPGLQNATSFRKLWKSVSAQLSMEFKGDAGTSTSTIATNAKTGMETISQNLPTQAKFVLVAAYLASQNPISSDKRFFVRGRTTRRKPNIITTAISKNEADGGGSNSFVHSRLIAIVAALIEQNLTNEEKRLPVHCSGILSIIPYLTNLGLLERVGNPLDECKYRCEIDFELIKKLGSDISVDVCKYLHRMI